MNEQLTTTSILSLLETTKAQRRSFAEDVLMQLESGNADPLKIHLQIKATEALIKTFLDSKEGGDLEKRYKNLVLDAAEKHGKNFEMHNATFRLKEAGTKYDWSECGDNELLQQMEVYEAMGEAIKKRQEFLKTIPASGLSTVNEETGEVATLYSPAKSSTTTVSVTLK